MRIGLTLLQSCIQVLMCSFDVSLAEAGKLTNDLLLGFHCEHITRLFGTKHITKLARRAAFRRA